MNEMKAMSVELIPILTSAVSVFFCVKSCDSRTHSWKLGATVFDNSMVSEWPKSRVLRFEDEER